MALKEKQFNKVSAELLEDINGYQKGFVYNFDIAYIFTNRYAIYLTNPFTESRRTLYRVFDTLDDLLKVFKIV